MPSSERRAKMEHDYFLKNVDPSRQAYEAARAKRALAEQPSNAGDPAQPRTAEASDGASRSTASKEGEMEKGGLGV